MALKTHNMGTVFGFEVRRTLRRPSFWFTALGLPLFLLLIMGISMMSGHAAASSEKADRSLPITFTYTDASGLIDPAVARAQGGTLSTNPMADKDAVIAGNAAMFVSYPSDPSTATIQVVAKDAGLVGGPDYTGTARRVLEQSVKSKVPDARVASILAGTPTTSLVTYKDGSIAPGWASVVAPGAFVVLFYIVIMMLSGQMMNVTVEEKENRVTEMILTTIHPTSLIVGKILALVAVGVLQILVSIIPFALAALLVPGLAGTSSGGASSDGLDMPSLAQVATAFNPGAIGVGFLLFVGSFLLYTGILVSIGAVMPTAKDGSQALGVVMVCLFVPLYAMGVVMTDPHGLASQILTFFPLTSPLMAMIRNAVGTLNPWETIVTLVLLYGSAFGFIALGIRLFRAGSIQYGSRLKIWSTLGWGKKAKAL